MNASSSIEEALNGVPPDVRQTTSFQRWYRAQADAGNQLKDSRLLWSFDVGDGAGGPFLWSMQVAWWVAEEDRIKSNEVVISRPDISAVALFHPAPAVDDTTVVLIREFRSPVSTPDGYVHELPSGSGTARDQRTQAAEELHEETGFVIKPDRLRPHGSGQAAGTLSAHHVHLFSATITDEELTELRRLGESVHGDGQGSERTWIEIETFGQIRRARLVDWTTLGLLTQALLDHMDAED